MPFLSRRVWLFLLLDAVILLGLMTVFAAVNHAFVPARPPISERILTTPTDSSSQQPEPSQARSSALASIKTTPVVPSTIHVKGRQPIEEATAADVIDLKKILCKKIKVLVHEVKMGENYWTIAKDNNIDVYTLIGGNPDMPYKTRIHQMLNILSQKGTLHTVRKSEGLSDIADEYRIDEKELKDENGISWWRGIHEGDVLFILGSRPLLMAKEWKEYFSKRGMFGVPFARWATWTSTFGLRTDPITGEERTHKGVDLRAKYGDPVYAAAAGKVIFTGISGGYGNLIQIRHAGGYVTYYGHLSKIYAKSGQTVRRGTLIGRVGATGRVTGPHLHFEIRKNGVAVDPLQYI